MKLPLKHTGKITPENVLHDLLVNLKVSSLNVKRLKKTFVSILPSRHFASQGTQVFFC
jgi:predicted DNA-binding protein (MmcQ/YjbR family)